MMADRPNYRDEIAAEIISRIESGTAPWQKPWRAGTLGTAPFNPISGKPYRGINDMWLTLQGRDDPRWMTYKQAGELEAQVRKGEKSTTIEYWQWTDRQAMTDAEGKPVLDGEGKPRYQTVRLDRPRVFYAKVFNAEQIDGLEPFIPPPAPAVPMIVVQAETMISSAEVPIHHDQVNRAFYNPARDEIHLPPATAFHDFVGYYETKLHELGHATGHPSRLNRSFGPFGSEGYAREELRAEIASYMLARDLGVSFDPSNHAAYVESWLKALREDKNEIFRAAKDAEIIKTWVMEPERRPELEQAAQQQRAVSQSMDGVGTASMPPPPAQADKVLPMTMDVHPMDRLENYYRPGRIVPAYFGNDQVVEFRRPNHDGWDVGGWGVDVRQVEANGQLGELRTHCTVPSEKLLAEWEKEHPVAGKPRVYLTVPFAEKDHVKQRGGKWDEAAKSWYVPPDRDPEDYARWIEKSPTPSAKIQEAAMEERKPRIFIAVPFAEKDEAKAAGAKWDRQQKSWYIPDGLDAATFSKWSAPEKASAPPLSPVEEFAETLKVNGLQLRGAPVMDGEWHRVSVDGDKKGQLSGSYRGFLDGRPSGQITNYRAGGTVKWVATGVALTDDERARIQAEAANVRAAREKAQLEAAEKAAKVAYGVWNNLPAEAKPDNCPYLIEKGVQGHGVKVNGEGHLVVPCRDANGRLWNIQIVAENGKRFLKDSHKVGTMHVVEVTGKGTLSAIPPGSNNPIIIAEGYATASTIHERTGLPVVAAFDAGNLKTVAEAVRAKHPDRPILIAADNDHSIKEGNIGMIKAEEAAKAVGGVAVAPKFTPEEMARGLTDFNDLHQARGGQHVSRAIEGALSRQREPERSIA